MVQGDAENAFTRQHIRAQNARMETETLRLFLDCAQRGSFAAVARERDLDPSAVSRAIALLEDELGVRLFQRSTRRMTLTEAGALYRNQAGRALENLERARDAAQAVGTGVAGTLRLTASIAFGHVKLAPLLPAFRAAFPKLRLEVLLSDARLDLVADRIDLAVRLGPMTGGDSIAVRLFDMRYRIVASPDWVRRHGRPATPTDLAAHDCLLFDLPDFRTRWRFRDADDVVSEVAVDGSLKCSSILALRTCALAGMGPALLVGWLVDADIASGSLADLFPRHVAYVSQTPDAAAWLVYPSREWLPLKTRAVIDWLRPRLA